MDEPRAELHSLDVSDLAEPWIPGGVSLEGMLDALGVPFLDADAAQAAIAADGAYQQFLDDVGTEEAGHE